MTDPYAPLVHDRPVRGLSDAEIAYLRIQMAPVRREVDHRKAARHYARQARRSELRLDIAIIVCGLVTAFMVGACLYAMQHPDAVARFDVNPWKAIRALWRAM